MNKRIWKYQIPIADDFRLKMPDGARILTVQIQEGGPCIWAVEDPEAVPRIYHFRIVGTGHEFSTEGWIYIGTFQSPPFVWHLLVKERNPSVIPWESIGVPQGGYDKK